MIAGWAAATANKAKRATCNCPKKVLENIYTGIPLKVLTSLNILISDFWFAYLEFQVNYDLIHQNAEYLYHSEIVRPTKYCRQMNWFFFVTKWWSNYIIRLRMFDVMYILPLMEFVKKQKIILNIIYILHI